MAIKEPVFRIYITIVNIIKITFIRFIVTPNPHENQTKFITFQTMVATSKIKAEAIKIHPKQLLNLYDDYSD